MNCSEVHNDLIFFIEGSLDEKRSTEIKEHLSTCKKCSDFADYLRESLDIINEEKQVAGDSGFAERIISILDTGGKDKKTYSLRILKYAAAAAVIMLGVFTGINLGKVASGYNHNDGSAQSDELYYLNDLYQEPIESFFLIKYEDNE